jgi:hypothetical protein
MKREFLLGGLFNYLTPLPPKKKPFTCALSFIFSFCIAIGAHIRLYFIIIEQNSQTNQ